MDYNVNGQALYAAIFERVVVQHGLPRHGLTAAQYHQTFNDLTAQGYPLRDVVVRNLAF